MHKDRLRHSSLEDVFLTVAAILAVMWIGYGCGASWLDEMDQMQKVNISQPLEVNK
jgi:hypothetical protein